jgi:Fe-S-cluster containining protein
MMPLTQNSKKTTEICRKCKAFCCKFHIARPLKTNKKKIEYWEARKVPGWERREDGNRWLYVVHDPCPKLKNNKCTIYDKRPAICREFPPKEFAGDTSWCQYCELLKLRYPEAYSEMKELAEVRKKKVMRILP